MIRHRVPRFPAMKTRSARIATVAAVAAAALGTSITPTAHAAVSATSASGAAASGASSQVLASGKCKWNMDRGNIGFEVTRSRWSRTTDYITVRINTVGESRGSVLTYGGMSTVGRSLVPTSTKIVGPMRTNKYTIPKGRSASFTVRWNRTSVLGVERFASCTELSRPVGS